MTKAGIPAGGGTTMKDTDWDLQQARLAYNIPHWSNGYFDIDGRGRLLARPGRDRAGAGIDLYELTGRIREMGLATPVLVRFTDILHDRIDTLCDAFAAAMKQDGYTGGYSPVYPIKVNQQHSVVAEILRHGNGRVGLEAGSKPELLAVLGLTENLPNMPIVCNGFKDSEFIETVILATKLGRHIIPVVERFSDLEWIIRHAKRYMVRPRIGVRAKPSAQGTGRWQTSGGMRSKFGLTMTELLHALERLKQEGMADCLNMIHFHIGSQIGDIRAIKGAVNELAHIYCELKRQGAGLDTIDVGGGMGIDYDGSASSSSSSVNYGVAEYAADIVYRVKSVCDAAGYPHPRILSESGRAMVAHSSLLIVDVLGATKFPTDATGDEVRGLMEKEGSRPQPVLELIDAFDALDQPRVNLLEVYHDAAQAVDEAMSLFNLGYLSLPMRSATERLFWAVGQRVLDRAKKKGAVLGDDLGDLPQILSDIYYVNFSIFQSLPDHWAIDQLFPIVPIHRLDECPTRRGVLADITCDSDGQVDKFIDARSPCKPMLELHEPREGEHYYLGVFLLGAYQEVLGDLHNLYGDTHVVHVSFDDSPGVGDWDLDEVIEGDTVKEVLAYVQYDSEDLIRSMRRDVERAVKAGRISVSEGQNLLKFYDVAMEGYTYLE